MNVEQLKSFQAFAEETARKSGKILTKYWGKLSDIQQKSHTWDLVTEADKESEAIILDLIKKQYSGHAILSEEAGLYALEGSDYAWIVDPLDGTTNYTHQYPMVSVSIALAYRDKPIVGVVYNPILEEMFLASVGRGATLNGKPIHVSNVASLDLSLLSTGFAYDRNENSDNNYAEFCHLTQISQGVRRGGSAAIDLAYVAAGRLDGYWERGLKPWDIAAGVVIIQEAGGRVSSYEGADLAMETGRILTTNGRIHDDLIQELKKASEEKIL